ncbi:MAG: glyoxalase [gamma proteobacterium symbiont of Ctena orbiculata]|uniref:VOC family protein n=1 Tax=Candidatus Thiodiazotropha taylori TaxID=2792791 RepID=A0A944MAD3_9GAMM|nr:VOC family protein [Candidatus Thiodiazotropha taylori]PVV06944.1 MAG: glyoxalase [gamma proteobacterium symbiont of Ctena orbiculata]MBT2990254.1 VOC family protein [Candidatus Thiodiazotropha taylori]MBT2998182.1 VOC family protein [Candidatus Thiodiazotropha taylori]MBT3002480.1 VOC family protein [Candidatus Thiodiazotropha taylori]
MSAEPFVWHELVTSDQEKSGWFFKKLLGWETKQVDAGEFGVYTLFQKDGKDIAGMMNPTPDTPKQAAYWHSYIAVEDVDGCAEAAPEIGGTVLVPPHDIADVGRICIVADPMGAVAHLITPL